MADADPAAGGSALKTGSRRVSRDPKVFVLDRELAEVHLLLDNVSANPNTTVAERVAETQTEGELDPDWIEKVCQISWPPDGSEDERADDAALLIRAKDHLNRLSYPASGSTIAFTLLVTQEEPHKKRRLRRPKEGDDTPQPSPTRSSLAETAYPDLVGKAEKFRKAIKWISLWLVGALLLTCLLSWYVAYGNAGLAELKTAEANLTEANNNVAKAEAAEDEPAGGGKAAPAATGAKGNPATAAPVPAPTESTAKATAFIPYCDRGSFSSASQMQACEARRRADEDVRRVQRRLVGWVCWGCFTDVSQFDSPREAERSTKLASGSVAERKQAAADAAYAEQDRIRQRDHAARRNDSLLAEAPSRASALANIVGSAVLPFFYGLLGAGAAIIRSLSRKIRASLLSPRDLHLSLQQLALGAVVGACIGLFVAAPGEAGKGESLLGPVTLSASAISFVAGFGVESVFQALEALISRIFNIAPAAAAAAPPLAVPPTVLATRPARTSGPGRGNSVRERKTEEP